MMLLPQNNGTPEQRELLAKYKALDAAGREQLLAFAEFLQQRQSAGQASATKADTKPQEPLQIGRPEKESVVAAIRRLAETYPMLNKTELLHQASDLLSGHVLQGRPAKEVIDDLEALFAKAYTTYRTIAGAPACD